MKDIVLLVSEDDLENLFGLFFLFKSFKDEPNSDDAALVNEAIDQMFKKIQRQVNICPHYESGRDFYQAVNDYHKDDNLKRKLRERFEKEMQRERSSESEQ